MAVHLSEDGSLIGGPRNELPCDHAKMRRFQVSQQGMAIRERELSAIFLIGKGGGQLHSRHPDGSVIEPEAIRVQVRRRMVIEPFRGDRLCGKRLKQIRKAVHPRLCVLPAVLFHDSLHPGVLTLPLQLLASIPQLQTLLLQLITVRLQRLRLLTVLGCLPPTGKPFTQPHLTAPFSPRKQIAPEIGRASALSQQTRPAH